MTDETYPLARGDIRVRDPFIVAHAEAGLYRLYAQSGNRTGSDFLGVEAYSSPDLERWSEPEPVLDLSSEPDLHMVWAPEVHRWRGRWYLLTTLTFHERLDGERPVDSPDWPELRRRGTHVFVADDLLGPFEAVSEESLTPPGWMALDGTLHVEDGAPWMVFCHEWVQVVDGRMDAVRLTPDLSDTVGEPRVLFHASDAPGVVREEGRPLVTDAPFMHRTAAGELLMLWSTDIPGEHYSVVTARSESGRIAGPWTDQRLLVGEDGGHAMLFRTFEDELLLALHQPNADGRERLRLFAVRDHGDHLSTGEIKNA